MHSAFERVGHVTWPACVQDALALGTVFSATDSIATLQILDQEAAPMLYSLVFGEVRGVGGRGRGGIHASLNKAYVRRVSSRPDHFLRTFALPMRCSSRLLVTTPHRA